MLSAEANQFLRDGMEQLDHLLLGEREAKLGMLATMVMGEDILLAGPVGGGKTTLGRNSYRLIEDLNPNQVTAIPIQSDLQPQQLIGGTMEIVKEIVHDGQPATEVIRTTIEPIIKPHTAVIFANEINRISPFAINSSLEALESGVFDTTMGSVVLKGLEYVVSTMNPMADRSGTFPIDPAVASRHSVGAILGVETGKERYDTVEKIMDEWEPNPDAIRPVIDIAGLHDLRHEASHLPIPTDLKGRAVELAIRTVDTLKGYKMPSIDEADGRITKQVAKIAKTLAYLGAQERVTEPQLNQAVKYVVAARLGALSTKANTEVNDVHRSIVG